MPYSRAMNATQLLVHMTRRHLDNFFEVLHELPKDKLDWQPAPGSRSALDMLQEVATVFTGVPDAVRARKLEMTPEMFQQYEVERRKITDVAELEAKTRQGTAKFIEFIESVGDDELGDKVAMPWPGEFTVADLLSYHEWNLAYHAAQIYYIGTMLAKE